MGDRNLTGYASPAVQQRLGVKAAAATGAPHRPQASGLPPAPVVPPRRLPAARPGAADAQGVEWHVGPGATGMKPAYRPAGAGAAGGDGDALLSEC
jgi:hypothetical protein